MSTTLEYLSEHEAKQRQQRCRESLAVLLPECSGILVFSPVTIYYYTGVFCAGVLWLPREGAPVLLMRKGYERGRMESPFTTIMAYRSYSDLVPLCAEAGSALGKTLGVEKSGLGWAMGDMLRDKLQGFTLVDASAVLGRTRAIKSPYERAIMREAGARHVAAYAELGTALRAGMSERAITCMAWELFMKHGHAGIYRTSDIAGEGVLGTLSVGDNANYPITTDSTVGHRGGHPLTPYFGDEQTILGRNMPVMVDLSFCHKGYFTDKTQVYWSGPRSGIPGEAQRAHDVCVAIHEAAASMLKPGTTPAELWQTAHSMAVKAGFGDAFMGCGANQVAFLGHGIGLANDEFPVIAPRFIEPFVEGMMIALEPKIGLPGIGMVGLENVFEVTAGGGQSLSGTSLDILCCEG